MSLDKNTVVGVVGAGTMGAGIAQVAASAGHKTILFENNGEVLARARARHQKTFQALIEKGKITQAAVSEITSKIAYASSISELAACGIIIEAIFENLQVKQELFKSIEKIISPDAVLASNTSSLSITSLASSCNNSSRFIGIHFFNPAPLMPLVEIVPAVTTNSAITEASKKLIDSWGKVTVLAKDTPGFIVNRVARSYYCESIRISEEGIADYATIDWAMKEFGGFKMGPFELMDFIGNDVNYKVTETVWEQFFFEPRFKPSFTQKRLFEAKHFGRKSGKGYYEYGENAKNPEPKKDSVLGKEIFSRVITMLINEAADTLYLNVATREDIDLAMTKGVNYPKGLLKWADEIGIKKTLDQLQELYSLYQEDRYRPSVLLKKMVKENKTFY